MVLHTDSRLIRPGKEIFQGGNLFDEFAEVECLGELPGLEISLRKSSMGETNVSRAGLQRFICDL